MRLFIFILLLCFLPIAALLAQDIQGSVSPDTPRLTGSQEDPAPAYRVVRRPREDWRMSEYILFVIDISGSMDSANRFEKALQIAHDLMEVSTDLYYIGVIVFNDNHERWEGIPDEENRVPPGWAAMPNGDNSKAAREWVRSRGTSRSTNPATAFHAALAEPQPELTVVLITDGEFNHGINARDLFAEGQANRVRNEQPEAGFIIFGVGEKSAQEQKLLDLAEHATGGFYVQD